jgi:small GTP-binding protein
MSAIPSPNIQQIKVLILGDSAVGKTAIIHQFVDREFPSQYQPTVGSDVMHRQMEVNGLFLTLQIWDTAGQECYQSLTSSFFRGADICILVYDITAEHSFFNLSTWHSAFLRACEPVCANFPFLLLGNKVDESSKRVISTEKAKKYAEEHNFLFSEVSAKSSENISEAIEAAVRRLIENSEMVHETMIERFIPDTKPSKSRCNC